MSKEISKKEGIEEPQMITDMLGELCKQLSTMFYSFSQITRTCMGLKEQLGKVKAPELGMDGEDIKEDNGYDL